MIRKLDEENLTYAFPEVAFDNDYVIATYQAKVKTSNIEKLAMAIADEQTTGTWIKVGADSMEKTRRFGSKLVALYEVPDIGCDYQSDEPPMYIIQVAYPMENFSHSMSSLMTILFGNISASGMIRLIDVAFPKKMIQQFQGPKFGVEGLRKVLGVPDRPLLNAMIKPNIGWTADEGADLFYHACKGGVRQFVERKLAPWRSRFLGLHAVDLDVSTPEMHLISPYDDGNELLKKTDVMALYDYRHAVGIGDSFTDMKMSLAVDTIFARDVLAQYLQKMGRPYLPYDTFFDVTDAMQSGRIPLPQQQ